jgi:hypothetical protein
MHNPAGNPPLLLLLPLLLFAKQLTAYDDRGCFPASA